MHRIEVLWMLSGTHMQIFCVPMLLLDLGTVWPCKSWDFNYFFWTVNGRTTDRHNQLLNPCCTCARRSTHI